ncbi:MAG: hypothetical protein U0X40_01325 [Ferruginibacter sp.]
MKKLLFLPLVLVLAVGAHAQSDKFVGAMKKNIDLLDSAFRDLATMQSLANNFERIANAEKNQWLAYYYAAYCQINSGYIDKDKSKTDSYADKAASLIARADSLSPKNSEISCIKSMIASLHMMVNPMQRYMQYGQEIQTEMENAMEQDPSNPRPYLLKGQGLRYTPEQFGGGCATAKPELQKAADLFSAFKPASEIHPNWGKQRTAQLLGECSK